jgi:tRNA-2-methylthio-N6-dimethylallyladenosine synthase
MNVHDSEMLSALLRSEGWAFTADLQNAEVIILNTCSVREKAEQKVFSRFGVLKQLKHENPGVRFVLAGCMAKAWGRNLFKRIPTLDIAVGPGRLNRIPEYLRMPEWKYPLIDIDESSEVFCLPPDMMDNPGRTTAWVTVMEGCDNFCTYCIVPYVRGRERSRNEQDIVREVEILAGRGVREITLLGQNVNSYSGSKNGFPELLRKVHDIDGLLRIRFTTSHPKDMSDDLIETVAALPKVCEYLHFPVQSGSSDILKRMNRGYNREMYLDRVAVIKRLVSGVALSSDFMVGFPGETECDHRESVLLVESVGYDNIFIFMYNPRPGTRAADLEDTVPFSVKTARLEELLHVQRRISMERNNALIGSVVEVLAEGPAKRGQGIWTGRNRQNRVVNFTGQAAVGSLCSVVIESASPNCLYGRSI